MRLDFTSRHAFLARIGTPEGIAPVFEWNAAFFIYRANTDSILPSTLSATPEIPLVPGAVTVQHFVNVRIATMQTLGRFPPPLALHEFHGDILICASKWQGFDDFRL